MSDTWVDPHAKRLAERKQRFAALLAFVTKHNGWLISVAGDPLVQLETLPDSTLAETLRQHGYVLHRCADGQRIVPGSIVETFTVEGSSVPVVRHHAGICPTWRFTFVMP